MDRTESRRAHDRALRTFTQTMDVAAQDNRMKYERPQFAVVGEGTQAAQENYRKGWERIFGAPRSSDLDM